MPVSHDPISSSWQARRRSIEALERGDSQPRAQFLIETIRTRQRDIDALSGMLRLLHAGDPQIVNDLVKLSTDLNNETRLYAVLALGELNVPEGIPALLAALHDLDPNVRFNAVEALGKMRASQAVEPLLEILNVRDFFLIFPTLEALGKIGDPRALPHLMKALGNPLLAPVAAQAIGEIGDLASVSPIVTWMCSPEGDIYAGLAALASILKKGYIQPAGKVFGKPLISRKGNLAAQFVATSLGEAGVQKLLEIIPARDATNSESSPPVPAEDLAHLALVLRVWIESGEHAISGLPDGLVRLLVVPSSRADAALALAYCGESALPYLAAALEQPDPVVQYEILKVLGKIASPAVVPQLAHFLTNENHELVIQSATSLASLDNPEAREALINSLGQVSTQARGAIMDVMVQSTQLDLLEWVNRSSINPESQLSASILSIQAGKKPAFQDSGAALLVDLIHEHTGHHYETDSQARILDKLKPLILELGLDSYLDFYYLLKNGNGSGNQGWQQVEAALAVNETYFWREYDQVRVAAQVLIPGLQASDNGRRVRIWHAACASGEEPYTMALTLLEAGAYTGGPIEIVATDFNKEALERAAKGIFRPSAFRAIPPLIQERYFLPLEEGRFRLADSVRDLVQFNYLNLMDAQAMERMYNFDLIFCRNAFIYFSPPAIQQVLERFYSALRSPGYLFVAASESLLRLTTHFRLCDVDGAFVYQKEETGRS